MTDSSTHCATWHEHGPPAPRGVDCGVPTGPRAGAAPNTATGAALGAGGLRAVSDPRTLALLTLAVVGTPFALYAGAGFFIPLVVSLFVSYALSPAVERLERMHVPRALGAAITLTLVVALTAAALQLAISGARDVLDELPQAAQRLRYAVTSWQRDGDSTLKQVRKTADELQKLAGVTTGSASAATGAAAAAPEVRTEGGPSLPAGASGMAIFVGQITSVLFLSYFLLAAGDLFRRRLVQAAGPSIAARRKTLQILRQIHEVSQRYFALVLGLNVVSGALTALALSLLGIHHAVFWGVAMAVLHTIPYVGSAVAAGAVGLSAYAQTASVGMALAAAVVPVAVALVIGIWLQTALLGRAGGMNAVVVFVALLFWGTVWGAWGLLLAFPIMAAIKIVFAEIERLKPLAIFMSE